MSLSNRKLHVEPHIKESNYIRDIVFGFGDGINTSLGIVAGIGGASIGVDIVILAALIGMFTGAKAMAVQNYLAVKSQREILESEIKREEYEIEHYPDRERGDRANLQIKRFFGNRAVYGGKQNYFKQTGLVKDDAY